MKRVRELELLNQIKEIREFEFGVFYFFKKGIIISEVNEGILFSWENAKRIIYAAQKIYGTDYPLIYLSNRVNRYYVLPHYWLKFYKNRYNITSYAVVGQTKGGFLSQFLERIFFRKSINKFHNLDKAVEWALDIAHNPKK